jgi:hypothetical protein
VAKDQHLHVPVQRGGRLLGDVHAGRQALLRPRRGGVQHDGSVADGQELHDGLLDGRLHGKLLPWSDTVQWQGHPDLYGRRLEQHGQLSVPLHERERHRHLHR